MNRVDDIIMFDQLDKAAIHKIIDIELQGLYQRVSNLGYGCRSQTRQKISLRQKATISSSVPVR